MTQPAVHRRFRQNTPRDTPHDAHDAVHDAAHADAHGPRREAGSGRRVPGTGGGAAWRKAAAMAASGVPVGLLWWLLAPSGLNLLSGNPELRSGGNTDGWLPRDLVLAGLFLLAGCVAGAVASGGRNSQPSGRDVLLAVGAGAVGSLAAWGTGVLCGQWWGAPADALANASTAFSLRSFAVLAIWPAAAALTLFLTTVFATQPPEAGNADAERPSPHGPV